MPKWPKIPKSYSESMTTDEIWSYFEKANMAHLATMDGTQPRVRIMALIKHDKKLYTLTHTSWNKVRQITENNKVEFTSGVNGENGVGVLRTTAIAHIVENLETRQKIAEIIPWFTEYWDSPDDDNFTLIELIPTRVLFDHPDDGKKYRIDF